MQKSLIIAGFLLISQPLFSQDFDKLMDNRIINCSDISKNSAAYFVNYMNENKFDTAGKILKYWERRCGEKEPLHRAKIILALEQGKYSDTLLSPLILDYVFNYQNRIRIIKDKNYAFYDEYQTYFGYIPPGEEFDKFTRRTASILKRKYDPESIEYLWCEFYSDNSDTIFERIQSGHYSGSRLSVEYYKAVNHLKDKGEFNMALIVGVWMPTGELDMLGIHPELGFQMGAKHRKMNYDVTLIIRFVDAPQKYPVRSKQWNDSIVYSNHFLGGYIGFDVGRDMYLHRGHELQLTSGIALDGFDAIEKDEDQGIDNESIWSYNVNLGLGYRYYITNQFYIGLRVKYNFIDYTLNNAIDMAGNAFTVQFLIGGLSHTYRTQQLRELDYKGLRK